MNNTENRVGMKKLFLLYLLFNSAAVIAMEKNDELKWLDQLPLSQKIIQLNVIDDFVNSSSNVPDAIEKFLSFFEDQLKDTRADLVAHNRVLIESFLNRLLYKFPGQIYLITRLLFTTYPPVLKLAQKKFNTKIEPLLFKKANKQQTMQARDFIEKNDKQSLLGWLKTGYDPNFQIKEGTLLTFALSLADLDAVHALIRYGADLYSTIDIPAYGFRGTPYQFLQFLLQTVTDNYKKRRLREINDYLLVLISSADVPPEKNKIVNNAYFMQQSTF